MEAKELSRRLADEWHEILGRIAPQPAITERLSQGGRLKVFGSADAAEAWLREALTNQVVRLDLEGWEPGHADLDGFAAYQQAVRGEAQVSPGESAGALDAARFSMRLGPMTLDGENGAEELADYLTMLAEEGPTAVLVPDGDILPENVRQPLADACRTGSKLLWVEVVADEGEAELALDLPRRPGHGLDGIGRRLDEPADGHPLRHGLAHWAMLSGRGARGVPFEPVLDVLGMDEDLRETLIDLVDDELVEGEDLELLKDLQFLHPSFSEAVYRPAHPLVPSLLLQDVDDEQRRQMATLLFSDLRRRLQPSRGSFTLLLRLAEACDDQKAAYRLRLRLRWWTDGDNLDGVIARALQDGAVTPEDLWILTGESYWPPDHRLAFLNGWIESAGDPAKEGDVELLRAEILYKARRLPEAIDAVRRALEIQGLNHGPKSQPYLAALNLCAMLLMEVGETEIGIEQMDLCVELAERLLPEDDPKRAAIMENHGKALMQGGRLRQARGSFEKALSLTEAQKGPNHPATAIQRNNLAGILLETGELELARNELEKSVGIFESAFGPKSMELYSTLRNLVKVTDELQDESGTYELLERIAPLEEALLGSHPNLLSTWTRLAELRRDRQDRDGARFLFERALELAIEIFYGDHPSIPVLQEAIRGLAPDDG